MRLDQANRSFLAFVSVALLFGATVLCGAIGGVLVPLSLARMSHGGLLGLWNDPASLLAPPYVYFYDLPLLAVALAFLWRQRNFDAIEQAMLAQAGLLCLNSAQT